MSTLHRNMNHDAAEGVLFHAPAFIDSTDPATTYGTGSSDGVFAGLLWIEESSADTPASVTYRNAANSGWVDLLPWIPPTVASGDLLYADGAESVTALGLGSAGDILQVNAGGTAPEWASNIDIPGTLDVTGAGVFDSTLSSVGAATLDTGANGSSFGGDLTVGNNLVVSGTGPHAIGGTAQAFNGLRLRGTPTSLISGAASILMDPAGVTPDASASFSTVQVARHTITTAASGTHTNIRGLDVKRPTINAGTASVSNAVTLYVEAAPTGTATINNPLAFWVDDGGSRFDGPVACNDSLTAISLVASGPHHAFGVGSTRDYIGVRITSDFTSGGGSNFVLGVDCDPTLQLANGDTNYAAYFGVAGFGITTQDNSETIGHVASARFAEPNITKGATDTISVAATVYVGGAPTEGEENAAVWVDSGEVNIQGGVLALGETTTPTAVAGEARIYSKTDNNLYYQDGAGTEHQIATV